MIRRLQLSGVKSGCSKIIYMWKEELSTWCKLWTAPSHSGARNSTFLYFSESDYTWPQASTLPANKVSKKHNTGYPWSSLTLVRSQDLWKWARAASWPIYVTGTIVTATSSLLHDFLVICKALGLGGQRDCMPLAGLRSSKMYFPASMQPEALTSPLPKAFVVPNLGLGWAQFARAHPPLLPQHLPVLEASSSLYYIKGANSLDGIAF